MTIALVAAAPAGAVEACTTGDYPYDEPLVYGTPVSFPPIVDPEENLRATIHVDWGDGESSSGPDTERYWHAYRGGPGSIYRGVLTIEGMIKNEFGNEHPCRDVDHFTLRVVTPEDEARPPPCDALMRPAGCVPRAEFPVADLGSSNVTGDIFDGFLNGLRDDLTAIFAPDTPAFERAVLVATYGSYLVPGALVGGLAARHAARLGLKAAMPALRQVLGKPLANLVPGIQAAMSKAMSKLTKYRVRVSFQPPDHYFGSVTSKGKKSYRKHFELAIYKPGVKGSQKMLAKLPYGKATNKKAKGGYWQVEFHAGFDKPPSLLIKKHKKTPIEVELPPPSPRIVVSARPAPVH